MTGRRLPGCGPSPRWCFGGFSLIFLPFVDWYPYYAGLLFLVLVGVFGHCETRALLVGLILVTACHDPSSLFVAGVIVLISKVLDFFKAGRG